MTDFVKANRLAKVKVSEIVVMSEAARQRRAEGHDVINLGIGEPDFDTPDHANDAAIAAINNHDTHYPPIAGKPELREAIAALYNGRGGTIRRPEHVLVSSGSKYTLLNAMLASVNPGDEVIMLAPFWTSYADIVRLCGGIPVIIPNDGARQFRPDLDKVVAAMTPRTRWIMINSPNNPSGAVLSADDLRGIGDLIKAHPQAMLLSDEIYEHIVYSEKFISVADALPDIADRILIVSGVSKSYAMTGWRLGYSIGSKELIAAMTAVQAQGTSGTTTISQAAALAAITGDQSILTTNRDIFRQRRDLVCQHIKAMKGLTTEIPEGAFYVFASWQNCQGWKDVYGHILQSDMDFCKFILNEANVVVIPGSSFSMNGYFRISYASSTEELEEAMKRIANAMTSLKPA